MARPPGFDRDEALRRAMLLFWERGFERTSISDLCEAIGISAPSLYAAFGDKQSLFDAAVELYEESAVLAPALREKTASAVVEQLVERAVHMYTRPLHPRGCFVISDPTLTDRRLRGRQAIAARLREAKSAGDLADTDDVAALADYLDIVLRGMSGLARDGASRKRLRAAGDVAVTAWRASSSRR